MKIGKNILIYFHIFISAHSFAQDGKELFQNNCASCHSIGNGIVVGPDLKDIHKKHSEEWLIKWTKSSSSLIQSGDSAAVAHFNEFNKMPMTEFSFLSDNEIKSILDYIRTKSEVKGTTANTPLPSTPVVSENTKQVDDSINPHTFFNYLWIWFAIIFFLIIIWVLADTIKTLSKALQEEYKKNKPNN